MIKHQSNLQNVLKALDNAEERALTATGLFVRGESQMRSPVKTGAYRDSHDYRLDMNEKKVMVGNSIEYSIWLEIGSSRQKARNVIRNSVMDNVSKIRNLIAEQMKI